MDHLPSGTAAICAKCQRPYYLSPNSTLCIGGQIPHCVEYELWANRCAVCENGYYLSSQRYCDKQAEIARCSVYSNTAAGDCVVCQPNYVRVSRAEQCVVTLDPNCLDYSESGRCLACAQGHVIDTAGRCPMNIYDPQCALVSGG